MPSTQVWPPHHARASILRGGVCLPMAPISVGGNYLLYYYRPRATVGTAAPTTPSNICYTVINPALRSRHAPDRAAGGRHSGHERPRCVACVMPPHATPTVPPHHPVPAVVGTAAPTAPTSICYTIIDHEPRLARLRQQLLVISVILL